MRSTWLATRTARLNTVRGLLREFGIVIPVGAQQVVPQVRELLASSPHVPDLMRTSVSQACEEIQALATQMRAVERQLSVLARDRDGLGRSYAPKDTSFVAHTKGRPEENLSTRSSFLFT